MEKRIQQHFMLGEIEIISEQKGAIEIWNRQEIKNKKKGNRREDEKTSNVVFIQTENIQKVIKALNNALRHQQQLSNM